MGWRKGRRRPPRRLHSGVHSHSWIEPPRQGAAMAVCCADSWCVWGLGEGHTHTHAPPKAPGRFMRSGPPSASCAGWPCAPGRPHREVAQRPRAAQPRRGLSRGSAPGRGRRPGARGSLRVASGAEPRRLGERRRERPAGPRHYRVVHQNTAGPLRCPGGRSSAAPSSSLSLARLLRSPPWACLKGAQLCRAEGTAPAELGSLLGYPPT